MTRADARAICEGLYPGSKTLRDAYLLGFEAGQDGFERNAVPFVIGSPSRRAWSRGWNDSANSRKREGPIS